MSDKLPKKVKVPKALRKAGLETLLESSKGRAIFAEALMAAAQAAVAVLTASRGEDGDAAKTVDAAVAQTGTGSAGGKRGVTIAPASRRRVGRPRTMPAVAADKAPSPPARITPTAPAAGRKAAGTPVPRQRASASKSAAKTSGAAAGTDSTVKASADASTAPASAANKAAASKPAASKSGTRRGRPPRKTGSTTQTPKS